MIKQAEINYFRANILDKYIKIVEQQEQWALLEKQREEQTKQLIEYQKQQLQKRIASGKYKKCKTCGKVLKLDNFYKNPLKRQGVFDECKECTKKRQKEYKLRVKNGN